MGSVSRQRQKPMPHGRSRAFRAFMVFGSDIRGCRHGGNRALNFTSSGKVIMRGPGI